MVHFILENTDILVQSHSIVGALIGAGASLVGGLLGNKSQKDTNKANAQQNEMMMRFNREEAQKNRDWQERMSNTEMTRRVADLRSAGYNPAMINNAPAGESTPSGSSASLGGFTPMQAPTALAESVGQAGLTASQIELNKAQAKNLESQANKTDKETSWIDQLSQSTIDINTSAIKVNGSNISLNDKRKEEIDSVIRKANQETDNLKESLNEIKARVANVNADTAIKAIDAVFEEDKVKAEIAKVASSAQLDIAQTAETYKLMFYKALDLQASANLKNAQTMGQTISNVNGTFELQLRADDKELENDLHSFKLLLDNLPSVTSNVLTTGQIGVILDKYLTNESNKGPNKSHKEFKVKHENEIHKRTKNQVNRFRQMYGLH